MSDPESNNDILSCESENEDFVRDLLEGKTPKITEKINTRSAVAPQSKPKGRIIKGTALKRKLPSQKGGTRAKKPKLNAPGDIESLKSQLGLGSIVNSITTLTGLFQNFQNQNASTKQSRNVNKNVTTNKLSNHPASTHSTRATATISRPTTNVRSSRPVISNRFSRPNITSSTCGPNPTLYFAEPTNDQADDEVHSVEYETSIVEVPDDNNNYYPYVNIPDYSPGDPGYDFNDFDLNFLDNQNDSASVSGVDPQLAFQQAFESDTAHNNNPAPNTVNDENVCSAANIEQDMEMWDIPQLNTEEKTGPKISENLAKALNAALTVKSDKDSINNIGKKYLRPENVTYLCPPKVNKEIWGPINHFAHSKDLAMQEVQKYLALGLSPIVNMADDIAKKKEVNISTFKAEIADAISLIGHAFFLISSKRRASIKSFLNDRYAKICSRDIPITSFLFGDNCMSKLKEMGDINRIPIAKFFPNRNNANFPSGNLNARGPVFRRGGQGYRGQSSRGRFRQGNRGRRPPRSLMTIPVSRGKFQGQGQYQRY